MADDRQRLIPGEAPPAYSPPAGAVGSGQPAGAAYKYEQPPAGAAGYGTYSSAPNYPPAAPPSYIQQQPQTITVVHQQPSVVVVGGCPACRVGVLEDDFTCLGVLCAIFFFPIGLLCCLLLRVRRCPNCGAVFG